jgi:alkylation response protein AidB-like acyl-CoA dehydrogenase
VTTATASRRPLTVADFVADGAALSDEHLAIRAALRDFLDRRLPTDTLVTRTDEGHSFDRGLWRTMATQLGLQGMAIAQAYGGGGYGWVEACVAFHELGRVLYCGPYLATVALAAPLLHSAGGDLALDLLPRIAAGELTAAVAVGARERATVRLAVSGSGGYVLSGVLSHVLSGNEADILIVPVGEGESRSLFAVRSGAGVRATPMRRLDLTRDYAVLELDSAPARRVGPPGTAGDLLGPVLDRAVVALAAEQVGGAEKVLDMAVGYAKVRHQFGRPIGSFQIIKHTCSKMLLALESARALAEHAAWIADERPGLLPAAAAAAGSVCSEAFAAGAYDALHIHGGLGFTWEHPAHLYYRRARADAIVFGDADVHREHLARYVTGRG